MTYAWRGPQVCAGGDAAGEAGAVVRRSCAHAHAHRLTEDATNPGAGGQGPGADPPPHRAAGCGRSGPAAPPQGGPPAPPLHFELRIQKRRLTTWPHPNSCACWGFGEAGCWACGEGQRVGQDHIKGTGCPFGWQSDKSRLADVVEASFCWVLLLQSSGLQWSSKLTMQQVLEDRNSWM